MGPRIQGASTRKWSTVPNEFRTRCPFPASTRWSRVEGGGAMDDMCQGRSTPYGWSSHLDDRNHFNRYINPYYLAWWASPQHREQIWTNGSLDPSTHGWKMGPCFFLNGPCAWMLERISWKTWKLKEWFLVNRCATICNLTPLEIAIQLLGWSRESEESHSISSFGTWLLYRDYQHQPRRSKTNPTAPAS